MVWASASFDWNHIRAFLASVEAGSLSAAARALGQSQPTLSRQIAALEEDLGLVLFERVGRGLELTPGGRDLLEHVRAMGTAAERLSLVASGQSQSVEGTVTITASDSMSAHVLPLIVPHLRAVAPAVTLDIVAANDLRDLQRREADIAIRHVRPEQPELIARLVRSSSAQVYAARSYIAARGRPVTVEDLRQHDFIGFQPLARFHERMVEFGLPISAANTRLITDSGIAAWEFVRRGLGIGLNLPEIADLFPEVERLAVGHAEIPVPTWLTCHRELHSSRRIRLIYDALAEALGSFPDSVSR